MKLLISLLLLGRSALVLSDSASVALPIAKCPGYTATNVIKTGSTLTADLQLAGAACNTYGSDISQLKLEVEYETEQRLHVKISDTAGQVYQVPTEVFPTPISQGIDSSDSDFIFEVVAKPFSFAVLRATTHETLFNTSGSPLIFQSQYVFLQTSLPDNPNLYGLGEHSDTFRLPTSNYIRTLWSRDSGGLPPGSNLYGNHPIYYDHRIGKGTHGVFLLSSSGMDIKINKTAQAGQTLSYNTNGGIIDLYFMSGPSPTDVVQQYSEVVGKAVMMPYWSLGFHQCKYNYRDIYEIAEVIANYSAAGIPLQTMWTDLQYFDLGKDFSTDPIDYPLSKMREVINYLHSHNQHYILPNDPGVAVSNYGPYNRGSAQDVFLKYSNGSVFQGIVWAGPTAWPDWFHPNTEAWWIDEFARFFDPATGLDIDGLWIDMNEASNFCSYPCSDVVAEAKAQGWPSGGWPARANPRPLPGFPADFQPPKRRSVENATGLPGRNLLYPPYAIKNYNGMLSMSTLDTSLIHANGIAEYDTHNIFGYMTSITSLKAMLSRRPKSRPFLITRSTFAGAGTKVGHWLGDNNAFWEDYRQSIGGILNFASLFQIPMVGVDVCGFGNITTEALCSRWAMLGAFSPFYRNHNSGWEPHEFYVWPTTTTAAKKAIAARYKMLDYLYTGLYEQSITGTPVLNPLFFIYPEDANTFPIQLQFFFGNAVLVSPVTEENSTSVKIYLPNDIFYDLWTYKSTRGTGANVTLTNLNLTDIPVHIRGGTIVPMRIESAMTTVALRMKQFDIVVALGLDGTARGSLYIDDGDSIVQAAVTKIDFAFSNSTLTINGTAAYDGGKIGQVTFLGLKSQPKTAFLNGNALSKNSSSFDTPSGSLKVQVSIPLNLPNISGSVSFQ